MARKCFEVSSLKFRFNSYQTTVDAKAKFVYEGVRTNLKKYSSNTWVNGFNTEVDNGDIVIYIELSKKISLNIVINIVNKMYEQTGYELCITYVETNDLVTVGVLR